MLVLLPRRHIAAVVRVDQVMAVVLHDKSHRLSCVVPRHKDHRMGLTHAIGEGAVAHSLDHRASAPEITPEVSGAHHSIMPLDFKNAMAMGGSDRFIINS